ncbi:MAG: biotin--[acetyl-CoA-carboxylase] ligase [Lacipirellulaceae bacterium]
MATTPIDVPRLLAFSGVRPLVDRVEWFDEVPSTSDYAKQLVGAEGDSSALLVVAARQTAGRGRGGNAWWSSDGAILCSLLIDPAALGLSPDRFGAASLATALAVCDATRMIAPAVEPLVKWPNDVVTLSAAGPRKLAGVLLEAPRPDRLVIGIGWNLCNDFDQAPEALRGAAASVSGLTGQSFDATFALGTLVAGLATRLRQVAAADPAIVEDWNVLSLLTGREVSIGSSGIAIEGRCVGIAADGALVIDDGKTTRRCVSGTVLRYA